MIKINSIGYGPFILAASVVLGLLIPFLLRLFSFVCPIPSVLIKISLAIGLLVFVGLIVLLAVEHRQDKKADQFYAGHRDTRLKIGGDGYECQNCGSRSIGENDSRCPSCGIKFKQ